MYCSNTDLNKLYMFAFGYINNNLLNHLLHSNKYGIFVQTIYQLHSYTGKCSSNYLNFNFFFPMFIYHFFESFNLAIPYLFIMKLR